MSSPGFAFPFGLAEAFDDQGRLTNPDALYERDVMVEDALTFTISGIAAAPTFTAVSGGATIPYTNPDGSLRSFHHVPVVVISEGDVAGTAPVTYRQVYASTTTTSFKVKVFSGSTEQTSGTFRIAYIAAGT